MDLVIAVGGGGQHIALAIARLLRLGALASPIEAFVIDADTDSRLATRLKTFGGTVGAFAPHPLKGAETIAPAFPRDALRDTRFRRLFVDEASEPLERELFELFYDEASGGNDALLPGVDIAKGMYGNPSVGSAVFAAHAESVLDALIPKAQIANRIFVVGSFLGGTGAGITHQLVALLRKAIEQKPAELYGAFLLRWFELPPGRGDVVDNATMLSSMGHGLAYFYRHTRALLDASLLVGVPDHKPPALVQAVRASAENDEAMSIHPLLAAYGLLQLPARTDTQARTAHTVYGFAYDDGDAFWPLGEDWSAHNAPSTDPTLGARLLEATVFEQVVASFRQREKHFATSDYPDGGRTWGPLLAASAKRANESTAQYGRKVLDVLEARAAQLRFASGWFREVYGSGMDLGALGDPYARDRYKRWHARKWSAPDAFDVLMRAFPFASVSGDGLTPTAMADAVERAMLSALRRPSS
jgi:hypothetical protein